jgi:hypothetical protein
MVAKRKGQPPAVLYRNADLEIQALTWMQGTTAIHQHGFDGVLSGTGFIHALFHLERPSVTIVVRNQSTVASFPQYTYRLPGVGLNDFHTDDRLLLRLCGLHSLHRTDPAEAWKTSLEAIVSQGELEPALPVGETLRLSRRPGSAVNATNEGAQAFDLVRAKDQAAAASSATSAGSMTWARAGARTRSATITSPRRANPAPAAIVTSIPCTRAVLAAAPA